MPVISKSAREIVETLLAKGKRTEKGCLVSHLAPNKKGYVPVQVGGRGGDKWRAHRLVWYILKGPIPLDKKVCHSCDVRNCIEIEHLFLGTNQDNSTDMVNKNRAARLGRPAISFKLLEEAFKLKELGCSLEEIAEHQGLAGASSAADRIRRYRDATTNALI